MYSNYMIDIKNNPASLGVTRYLNLTYESIAKSVNRLASGLRIMTAADDPAGMTVSEMMKADIAALGQGRRNAMDAISMLQTAEAGAGEIDTILIRMQELAEQAATGTYTTTQKRTMQNEFESLADEITRIAGQMDFNGINLLNNSNSVYISVGAGVSRRGQFIPIDAQRMDAAALRVGGEETFVQNKSDAEVSTADTNFINFGTQAGDTIRFAFSGGTYIGFGSATGSTQLVTVSSMSIYLSNTTGGGGLNSVSTTAFSATYYMGTGQHTLASVAGAVNSAASKYATATSINQFQSWTPATSYYDPNSRKYSLDVEHSVNGSWDVTGMAIGPRTHLQSATAGTASTPTADFITFQGGTSSLTFTFGNGTYVGLVNNSAGVQTTQTISLGSMTITVDAGTGSASVGAGSAQAHIGATGTYSLDSLVTMINSAAVAYANQYTEFAGWAPAAAVQTASGQYSLDISHAAEGIAPTVSGTATVGANFAASSSTVTLTASTAGAAHNARFSQSQANGSSGSAMEPGDWVETEGNGESVDLVYNPSAADAAVDYAIETKDAYRAYLGYMANRLTSTSNTLEMQTLQLDTAVSRIQDVDVATETAELTRNMVLAQAGVVMLAMANTLPQLALSLFK
ncbi:MAG: hypothetical protein HZA50_12080 [Planctomycetes bacterium]|nr:hypothetical protein [Planctomycetota bacterium]